MLDLLPCPEPPDWSVDWEALDARFDWIQRLSGVAQDPVHHAEGDVWIHTRMVCQAMAADPAWRALEPETRRLLFASAMLHDVAKPDCTRVDIDGRITARGHSLRGAIMARRLLWEAGTPFEVRERITALVRLHQLPFFLIERDDAQRLALQASQTLRCDQLALLTDADARGRSCGDQQRLFDNIELFRTYCADEGCLETPREFPSDHGRFLYFREESRLPDYRPYEDFRCEVVLMSGLPGAGKDRWIYENLPGWPVISLDELRQELKVDPAEGQGQVITVARERARGYLRKGESFVWNATNLSRQIRQQLIPLFAGYGARVRIVYVEAPAQRLWFQNRNRLHTVPDEVIDRLLERWEVPDITEAHKVEWVVAGQDIHSDPSR